jgi:LemA protein
MIILTVIISIAALTIVLYLISIFNRLYSLKNSSEAILSQIGVALKKRLDLITQLVDSVKAYVKFEREIFERIAQLRSEMFNPKTEDLTKVERESRSVMNAVFAIAERYPDLKASTTVVNLMDAIRSVEDEIARQRYTYNNVIQEFNIMQDTFPSRFIAHALNFNKLTYLQFEEEVEKPPSAKIQD